MHVATNDHLFIQLAVTCVGTYNLPHKRHPLPNTLQKMIDLRHNNL